MLRTKLLLERISDLWHMHSRALWDTLERERAGAEAREARMQAAIDKGQDERSDLMVAFDATTAAQAKLLDEARRDVAEGRQRIVDLERSLAVAQNNFEWARVRLNSVEQERALLIEHVTKVRLVVPEITREAGGAGVPLQPGKTTDDTQEPGLLEGLALPAGMFEDMGDQAAAAAGLEHDATGAVVHK